MTVKPITQILGEVDKLAQDAKKQKRARRSRPRPDKHFSFKEIGAIDLEIMKIFRAYKYATVEAIIDTLGIPRTTAYNHLKKLYDNKMIVRRYGRQNEPDILGKGKKGDQFYNEVYGDPLRKHNNFQQDINRKTETFLGHQLMISGAYGLAKISARTHGLEVASLVDLDDTLPGNIKEMLEEAALRYQDITAIDEKTGERLHIETDDLWYLQTPEPQLIFIEADQGTEDVNPSNSYAMKSTIAKKIRTFFYAFRAGFFKELYGCKIARMMFIVNTQYQGKRRRDEMLRLTKRITKGTSPGLFLAPTAKELHLYAGRPRRNVYRGRYSGQRPPRELRSKEKVDLFAYPMPIVNWEEGRIL